MNRPQHPKRPGILAHVLVIVAVGIGAPYAQAAADWTVARAQRIAANWANPRPPIRLTLVVERAPASRD